MNALPSDLKKRALALARRASQDSGATPSDSVLLLHATLACREGNYQEALTELEKAEPFRDPITQARALAVRGLASFHLGRTAAAKQALQDAEFTFVAKPTRETGWWGVDLGQSAIEELRVLLAAK